MLFLYAATFSFAYLSLSAGTGALILFGAVQLTMLTAGLWGGERLSPAAWLGLLLALGGLVLLMLPGTAAPPFRGAALMAVAGTAWGVYSLLGRDAVDPLQETAANFMRAAPLGILLSVLCGGATQLSAAGVGLALVSGALASSGGYVIWYTALRGLSATGAATVQLSVPVIAALGGVVAVGGVDAAPGAGLRCRARRDCPGTTASLRRRAKVRAAKRNKRPKIAPDMGPNSRRGKGRIARTM